MNKFSVNQISQYESLLLDTKIIPKISDTTNITSINPIGTDVSVHQAGGLALSQGDVLLSGGITDCSCPPPVLL